MDPKTVKAAKEIPGRLKDVMNSMFEQSQPALRSAVTVLRDSLKKLDGYLSEVEREHLGRSGTSAAKAPAMKSAGQASGKASGKRRRKRFPISEFVLAELAKAGRPLRPKDLAERLAEETGRSKESASANIHTLLGRLLQQRKIVRSGEGLYTLAGGAAPAAKKARA